jgi:acyl-CoA synthetase (AMP-forming)/AMP-acid ligase II
VPSPASGLLQQRIQRRCVSDYENPLDDEVEITAENQFDTYFLGQCEANYRPMTPLSFLERNAKLYPTLPAYHYEDGSKRSWAEVYKRVKRFAYHLTYDCDIERKAVVSILAPNSPPIFEAHFSIMGAGAVIHAINYRLDARTIAFQLQHAKSKVLIVDTEFAPLAKKAIDLYDNEDEKPIIIDIVDPIYATASGDRHRCGEYSYEDMCTASGPLSSVFDDVDEFDGVESDSDDDRARRTVNDYLDKYENDDVDLSSGETLDYLDAPPSPGGEPGEEAHQHVDDFELLYPESEWDPISVCYTSGTTGNPKGRHVYTCIHFDALIQKNSFAHVYANK